MQVLAKEHTGFQYFFTDIQELDVCNENDVESFITQNAIDIVINCAAFTAVDKAESSKELCARLNSQAPLFLARAVERRNGEMIQISTDYVFDGSANTPYDEAVPTSPISTYGRTKLEGERNVLEQCRKAAVIRTAWLYSSFGNNFVKTMIRLGKEREQLGVVFDQTGTPTYARDLANAIFVMLEQGIVPGIYHFSNEGVASWYDFTKAIHKAAGIMTCQVRPIRSCEYPTPAARPTYSVLDKSKWKQTYHCNIPHWTDSLDKCITILKSIKE